MNFNLKIADNRAARLLFTSTCYVFLVLTMYGVDHLVRRVFDLKEGVIMINDFNLSFFLESTVLVLTFVLMIVWMYLLIFITKRCKS